MTTKPKTRKAPAAKTIAPALKPYDYYEAYYEANRGKFENDIPKLIARWHFLEADRRYHEVLGLGHERHKEEKDKIAQKLEQMTPENLEDARAQTTVRRSAGLSRVQGTPWLDCGGRAPRLCSVSRGVRDLFSPGARREWRRGEHG